MSLVIVALAYHWAFSDRQQSLTFGEALAVFPTQARRKLSWYFPLLPPLNRPDLWRLVGFNLTVSRAESGIRRSGPRGVGRPGGRGVS